MKFGKVSNPENIDFALPNDHESTRNILYKKERNLKRISVGCAKWNRADLKGFYPRGTKDELTYYSSQFNSIELNATFYRIFGGEQVRKWYDKTPREFTFFPKIPQSISQFKRLKNVNDELNAYFESITNLQEKLGIVFLQMHPYFSPKAFDVLEKFILDWPEDISLAVELRHPDWYEDTNINQALYDLLTENNITHIITDTAGRRDLVHMQLTTPKTFIRYTGANHATDYSRLDDWLERIIAWVDSGLEELNFFVHQNIEKESPLLSAYFIQKLNHALNVNLKIPALVKDSNNSGQLF